MVVNMALHVEASDDETSDYSSDEDSDLELKRAFKEGRLKPGLNIATNKPAELINDVAGMKLALTELAEPHLPWVERLDSTNEPAAAPTGMHLEQESSADSVVEDDFKRELLFYRQAQSTVLDSLSKLKKLGIATKRPEDYFAQMAKTDIHMKKVREKLLSKEQEMDRREKARKLRDLRKFGKKVQVEVLQKRQKEKREMLDAVKKFRKGQQDKLDFLDDDTQTGGKKKKDQGPNKKRQLKNKKFGFGGQKKRGKYNTATSAASMSDFSIKKNQGRPGQKNKKGNKNKPNKRPGKGRRQKMNSKR
ncbi:probable rRNA-processing protein EBP2 [Lineus longissimus]|uniref:probable rRNA-processing protein EBP2 n=1 Tax=Lineus longissimus TaxID=88925 RepID=UPI002B4F0C59